MERQIKFRAKHIKNGAWLYGDLLQSNEGSVYIGVHGRYIDDGYHFNEMYDETCYVDEDTIGQFTGLLDKNGREIYEGDIVKYYDDIEDELVSAEVIYHADSCSFCAQPKCSEPVGLFAHWQYEIIGNRFNHPSLISKKQ